MGQRFCQVQGKDGGVGGLWPNRYFFIFNLLCQSKRISHHCYVIEKFNKQAPGPIIYYLTQMVKIKDFYGAVFHPEEYGIFLQNNIEHLETIPMSKTFNTSQMLAQGKLLPEQEPFFYIYRQNYQGHISYGILAQISLAVRILLIQDYHHNLIKKHQKTLNRSGLNQKTYLQEHVGPVVVSHRQNQQIDQMILNLVKIKPVFSEWATSDGRQHTLWKIKKSQAALSQTFEKIPSLYILDGHHRLEAAHQNYLQSDKTSETDLWIQAVIYSSEYVMVHAQHRVIQDIPENVEIIHELMKLNHIEVTEIEIKDILTFNINYELDIYDVLLKLHDKVYGINFKNHSRNILEKVTSFRLQNEIFREFLSEDVLKKLKYIPGIIDQAELLTHQIVFFVKQPEIQTLFSIADEQISMPPKSTWIEPKPCSHMVIRLMN